MEMLGQRKIMGGTDLCQFLPMPILPEMENTECHFGKIYADILIFANFCQCQVCLKWKKRNNLQ